MMSLFFENPLNKSKKRFQQTDNPNQDSNPQFLLGEKIQISLHGSPIALILRNTPAKFGNELGLGPNLHEVQVGEYHSSDIQQIKEIYKEINKTRKRHNWKQIKILELRLDGNFQGSLLDFEYTASLFVQSFSDLTTLSLKRLDEKLGFCLISKIGRNLLKLKDLSLQFIGYKNVNESIKLLARETLGNLASLRYLHIDLSGSNNLKSDEIELLCEGINKKASRLVSLALDISSCRNFNDECMEVLGSKLCRGLSELTSLELNVSINFQVTNQGVMSLSNFLSFNLHKLRKLNISLFYCELVTTEGFVYFAEKIAENLQHLQELSFSFGIELQPGTEDDESSEEDDEDDEDDQVNEKKKDKDNGVEKKSLYDLRIEKERAYRNEIEEKLTQILSFLSERTLYLDSEVVLG